MEGKVMKKEKQEEAFSFFAPFSLVTENYIPIMHSALGHKNPEFDRRIKNVTVNVGREAVLECRVNHLGRYKVGWMKAQDQTILALHKRVITHNQRITVDHEENK